jgi:hypothetical protein
VRPLNFSSHPFRNEALPAVLFGAAAVLLVGVTVYHALVVRNLLPARTSKLHKEVAALEGEVDRLRSEARALKAPPPDKGVLAEWGVLKDLVDRRTFSWTGLFARLEQVLPRDVRLVSIAPDVKQGQVALELVAIARPPQAGLSLVGVLEGRGEFEDVYPVSVAEQAGGVAEFHYTMRYLPGVAGDAAVAPTTVAATEETADEAAEPEPGPTASVAPPPPSTVAAPGSTTTTRPSPPGPPVPARGVRVPPRKGQPEPADDDEAPPEAPESLN